MRVNQQALFNIIQVEVCVARRADDEVGRSIAGGIDGLRGQVAWLGVSEVYFRPAD